MFVPWRKITALKPAFSRTITLPYWQLCADLPSILVTQQVCVPPRFFSTRKPSHSPATDIQALNKQITHLIRSSRIEDARTLFNNINHKNTVTWNSMLSGHVHRREIAKARKLFDEMPKRDVVSWNLIISGYISCRGNRYLEVARYMFDQMPERDFISWNTMISGYTRNRRMDEALSLFNSMPVRNIVSWNAMISGFLQNGDIKSAIEFFGKMPDRDGASLSSLISGLIKNGELDEAARILLESRQKGDDKLDLVHAYNTLIAGYGQSGRLSDARCIFNQIPSCSGYTRDDDDVRFRRNVVSWNIMIMCYVKAGDIISARELFDQMVDRDTISWNTLISGYIHMSDINEASSLFLRMPNPDILSWNTMISGFAQNGNLELARNYFERMPCRNRVSWNSMIAGCDKNEDYEGAIKLYFQMQLEGEKPDRHTLSSLMSVCAEYVALNLGKQIHQQVTKIVTPDVPLNNSLITMYARCGSINEARFIFDEMKLYRDVISWNAMIGGYASHGFASEALELFGSMKKVMVRPTYITFISVLSACAHAGLVEEGRMHFKSMVNEFGIEARVEHYASLVDVVGRYGEVEDAMDLIKGMPFEADKAVWGALLGACRVHNNVKLAKVAAEALIRLEPQSSAPYVLLYNMYADVGLWDDATQIRMLMERNRITKEPAYSRVDSSS